MKLILIFSLFSINCFANDIRMATSEDIHLFDKALEASEKIIESGKINKDNVRKFKRNQLKVNNTKNDDVRENTTSTKPANDLKENPLRIRGSEDQEERARNKRKNKKRKRKP